MELIFLMLPDDSIPRCILLVFIILLSGFFSGSETAYSYVNKIRMKRKAEEGSAGAIRAAYIIDNFDKSLTTLLIGTNLCHVFASVIATSLAVQIWGSVGPVIVTIALTVIIFFFAETIPKNIARANSDAIAIRVSLPVTILLYVLTPVTWFFIKLGNLVKRYLLNKEPSPLLTEDEFQTMIDSIEEEGIIEHDEGELIKSAIEFSDISAKDIMIPVSGMVAIDLNESRESIRQKILTVKYSRIPVYSGKRDNIVGILHSKDFLQGMLRKKDQVLKNSITHPYFIKPEMKLDTLFEGLGRSRTHIAIVTGESGKALGIVTMEDILEVLFGEIYDEDETIPPSAAKMEGQPC
jgi:Putative Mg2+ and Co2+ transporter CorB